MTLIDGAPALARDLLKQIAEESRLTEDMLVSRLRDGVETRTARLLIGLATGNGGSGLLAQSGTLPLSRERMVLLVGTTRETLSRTLHDFVRRGILKVTPQEIRILDLTALEELVK